MLDNLHTDRVMEGWSQVRLTRMANGLDAARAAFGQEFAASKFGKGTEIRILTEFLSASLDSDDWTSDHPFGLSLGDVIEYLPVRELVPGKKSWAELRSNFEHEVSSNLTKSRNFKAWLTTRGAKIADTNVRQAARDWIRSHQDIQLLIKTIEAATNRR